MNFKDYIKTHNILADGSFGTYYAEKYHTNEAPEYANIYHKDRVTKIHSSYLEAGAKLIRTNTFAANTMSMQKDFSFVRENIQEAVSLARIAIKLAGCKDAFIVGDIGPISTASGFSSETIENEFYDIAKTFADEGIEIIQFETFMSMEILSNVIPKIKKELGLYIMVSFSVNQLGYSASGLSAKNLIREACEVEGVDSVGLNCGIGPYHMYNILKKIELPADKTLIAVPNAGYPVLTRNRMEFNSRPEYFAEKTRDLLSLGADIIGGCCGTSPEFISCLSEITGMDIKSEKHIEKSIAATAKNPVNCGFLYDETGRKKDKKFIAVELIPPFNTDDEKLLESAHYLKNAGVDVLTFPDSPSGRTRVDSVLMAAKVYRETGIEVMPHVCCRDKNAFAMRAMFMGAKINDIKNFLIITGDPVPASARNLVKSVFNFSSVGLMKIAQEMNKEVFNENPLNYGGAINQNLINLDSVINTTKRKMEAGANFFLTQPVFSKEEAKRLRKIKEETGACIFAGIMPLISRRNALFMKNELAGINVTDEIVERYPENGSKEEGEKVAVELAKEIISYIDDFADGYYFSFPFNRVYLLNRIL
ncbi:MAG: bifunctional homocysteine S-methyltransferase/methylenetetrahydrofolate reductase, partial [Clostridium sp.]|nr:bifunctional homocysteine S-methyltransferase/methylenetetrahydrofolate reductase [Clostridium sp.]